MKEEECESEENILQSKKSKFWRWIIVLDVTSEPLNDLLLFKVLIFMTIFADKDSSSSVVEDIVTLVKGGITETGAGVLAIRDPETYKKWGESLKYNPVLIEYEVS